ncbi:putative RNA-directed DNA polymerase, eukaryota, reverse transcriptase zinc-binding domain protein [Tanacetum coccineum]
MRRLPRMASQIGESIRREAISPPQYQTASLISSEVKDDLFLFARGHPNSFWVIIDALEEFKNVSGLVPSIPKSTTFFCNVLNALKASILCSMSFAKGTLPVKYLGVPLISFRLLYYDCKVLVEKLESRMKKGKAKVAWEAVCLPHYEGGLGIRRLDDFNVLINKESLWVQWIHSYKLKGRSFWDVPCLGDINNGRSTSMWFDRWADSFPLHDMLTVRNIVHFGFSLSNTVSDLISNGSRRWPYDWLARFPNVVNILLPNINNELDDVIVWRDVHGVFHRFSVAGACDSLRLRADVVNWYHVFWFPHCIPRHALHMWLVIKKKLKTQDRLRQWDVSPNIDLNLLRCPLFVHLLIVLAATTYCLWNEWNSRLFKRKKSTADQIAQLVTSLVRMKLVTFKFKKITTGSRLLLDQ